MQSDYASIKVASVGPIVAMVAGGIILITGILGFFTAMCRNSGINCLFAFPFVVLAFLCAVLLAVMAAVASGADGQVMKAKENACAYEIDSGVSLADKVQSEYTKLVDKNMCSVVCPCPLAVENTWTSIP